MTAQIQRRTALFTALAAGVYVTAVVLGRLLSGLAHPGAVAVGVTLDLTLLVPVAYYALIVRPRGWPPAAAAPAFVAGLWLATAVLPTEHRGTLRVIEAVVVPLEVGLLAWLVWRAARALRAADRPDEADPIEHLEASARRLVPAWIASAVATELAVVYYLLSPWRARAHVPSGAVAFTAHARSGHGGLVFGVLMIMAVEGSVVHLLLAGWSPVAAWVATALSVYGALWLLADYRATMRRPTLWDGSALWLRAGLRWQGRVRRDAIRRVVRRAPEGAVRVRSVAFLTEPNVWIECAEPITLTGPYGLRRETTWVGVWADDPGQLVGALTTGGAG